MQPAAVIEELRPGLEQIAAGQDARPLPTAVADALDELTKTLGLATVSVAVVGARVVGRGGSATVDLHLSDGTEVAFEHLRDVANPSRLVTEIAACTGATPTIKAAQAVRCVALLRKVAEHVEAATLDDFARAWGREYLQDATIIDLDIREQAARWRAFSELQNVGQQTTRDRPGCHVLLHTTGERFVRAGWFADAVRNHDSSVSHHEIGVRMLRVGWTRRGESGRIKATRPADGASLGWNFWTVPVGWEEGE